MSKQVRIFVQDGRGVIHDAQNGRWLGQTPKKYERGFSWMARAHAMAIVELKGWTLID